MKLKELNKYPLSTIGLAQAVSVLAYVGLVGFIMYRGNDIFGNVPNYLGPVLFLMLFSVSALICGVLTLAYPAVLFFKDRVEAIKLVLFTILWMLLFVFVIFFLIAVTNLGY